VRVDVHSHHNPPAFWEGFERIGAYDQKNTFFGRVPRGGSLPDPDLAYRVDTLDQAGVDVQVLSVGATHPYFEPLAIARAGAQIANDIYREAIDAYPGRFTAFGCLPLPHVDAALEELARCLDELEFAGINLGCSVLGRPLDAPEFEPLWAELDRRSAVVYLHPGVENGLGVGIREFHLDADFGSPAEIAVAACRLIATGVLERQPNVRVVLATLGGALPFLAHRFDEGFRRFYPDRHAELGGIIPWLQRFYYDTSTREEPNALLCARDAFGADRLVFGSDGPRITDPLPAVEYLRNSRYLTAAEATWILDEAGAQLLGATDANAI
jgi:predicted TIM-barrel fold metal-dependent hydrolase